MKEIFVLLLEMLLLNIELEADLLKYSSKLMEIQELYCKDCVASLRGCKHALCFIFWVGIIENFFTQCFNTLILFVDA